MAITCCCHFFWCRFSCIHLYGVCPLSKCMYTYIHLSSVVVNGSLVDITASGIKSYIENQRSDNTFYRLKNQLRWWWRGSSAAESFRVIFMKFYYLKKKFKSSKISRQLRLLNNIEIKYYNSSAGIDNDNTLRYIIARHFILTHTQWKFNNTKLSLLMCIFDDMFVGYTFACINTQNVLICC